MDKKFLDKVLDQIMSETIIDHEGWKVLYPFTQPITFNKSFYLLSVSNLFTTHVPSSPLLFLHFINHCEEVYGLNKDEVKYVWEEYRYIIKDKLPY